MTPKKHESLRATQGETLAWVLLNAVEQTQHLLQRGLGMGLEKPASCCFLRETLGALEAAHWDLKIQLGLFVGRHPLVQAYQSTEDSLLALLHRQSEDAPSCNDRLRALEAELLQLQRILSLLHELILVRPQALFQSQATPCPQGESTSF